MLSLLAIVIALLTINLWAIADGRVVVRIPFGLAVCALVIALLAPFAGLFRIPLPSQFLLLWLLIIPIAIVAGVACTLIGLAIQAGRVLAAQEERYFDTARRPATALRRLALAAPIMVIAAVVAAEALPPARLFTAPVQGVETSTGTVVGGVRYGASFSGMVRGDPAGTLSASANYTPAFPGPGVANAIVGGNWSLAVYKDGRFRGMLFGPLAAGTVRWNMDATEATMDATLMISGGTGSYISAHGSAAFTGTLVHLTYPPTVAGTLTLRLQ
jgi:hypothetical protein